MTIRRLSCIAILVVVAVLTGLTSGSALAAPNTPDPATGFLLNGRQLTPSPWAEP